MNKVSLVRTEEVFSTLLQWSRAAHDREARKNKKAVRQAENKNKPRSIPRRSFLGSCRRSAMSAAISATTVSSSSMALGLSGFEPPDFDLAVLFPRPNLGLLDLEGRPLDRSPRRSLMDRLVPLTWSLQDFLGAWMSVANSKIKRLAKEISKKPQLLN